MEKQLLKLQPFSLLSGIILFSRIRRAIRISKSLGIMAVIFWIVLLGLSGCSTGISSVIGKAAAPHTGSSKARQLLKLSQESSPPQSLAYALQAADHFIQAREINEAQRALRLSQMMLPYQEPALRKNLLDARLALLKRDYAKARTLLNDAITALNVSLEPAPSLAGTSTNNPELNNGMGTVAGTNTGVDASSDNAGLATGAHTRIALILPTKGPHGEAAKTIRDGFLASYYKTKQQNQIDHSIKIYDSTNPGQIRGAYEKALAENANIIVGPLTKPEVQAIINLRQLPIPVLALNTLVEDNTLPSKLYQFGLMPEDEVSAIAEQALRHNHRRALIFAPQTEWGHRLVNAFQKYWQSRNGQIADIKYFNAQDLEQKIRTLLQTEGKNVDMLFLAASPEQARKIKPLLNNYHAENLAVYATSAVYSGTPSAEKDQSLNGIKFCDMPWMIQNQHQNDGSTTNANRASRFFALGMDAHQLALQLAQGAGQIPSYSLAGHTGTLHINHYRRIKRDLVCAKFENGVVVPES